MRHELRRGEDHALGMDPDGAWRRADRDHVDAGIRAGRRDVRDREPEAQAAS